MILAATYAGEKLCELSCCPYHVNGQRNGVVVTHNVSNITGCVRTIAAAATICNGMMLAATVVAMMVQNNVYNNMYIQSLLYERGGIDRGRLRRAGLRNGSVSRHGEMVVDLMSGVQLGPANRDGVGGHGSPACCMMYLMMRMPISLICRPNVRLSSMVANRGTTTEQRSMTHSATVIELSLRQLVGSCISTSDNSRSDTHRSSSEKVDDRCGNIGKRMYGLSRQDSFTSPRQMSMRLLHMLSMTGIARSARVNNSLSFAFIANLANLCVTI